MNQRTMPPAPHLDQRAQVSSLPAGLVEQVTRRTFSPDQQAARKQWDSVPLLQVPDYALSLVATGVNQTYDVQLPDALQVVMFSAQYAVPFVASFGRRAVMPLVSGAGVVVGSASTGNYATGDSKQLDPIVSPLGMMFYLSNTRTLSIGLAAIGDAVTILGWTQIG